MESEQPVLPHGRPRGPVRRRLAYGVIAAALAIAFVGLLLPVWGITASQVASNGSTQTATLDTYLFGRYTTTATGSNSTTCPLSGGNASQCVSLPTTARFYEVLEVLSVSALMVGVISIGLALGDRLPARRRARVARLGWVFALMMAIILLSVVFGVAFLQPEAFAADAPPGPNMTAFGPASDFCGNGHTPDDSFWAGCISATNSGSSIKWGPGVGWFLSLLAGVVGATGTVLYPRGSRV